MAPMPPAMDMLTTISLNMNTDASLALLSAMHLASPALPVGAFAYSQGLEYALDSGWVQNAEDVKNWIADNLQFGLGQLDLPIYIRLYRAWREGDDTLVRHWNQTLLALRETYELYEEEIQVGSAYARWHQTMEASRNDYVEKLEQPTVLAMASLASVLDGVPEQHGVISFAWSWVENQVTCASKAMPMGQTDGQRILLALKPQIAATCENALQVEDDCIGSGLFSMAMASARHEQQYSRLFRS